jgi:hypothetical protein
VVEHFSQDGKARNLANSAQDLGGIERTMQ